MWIFRSKAPFRSRKLTVALKIENPTIKQAQSEAGPLQRVSEMCHWLRPFLAGRSVRFRKQKGFAANWQTIVDYELKIWGLFLKSPRFPAHRSFLGNRIRIEIYTDACDRAPFENESISWESWVGIGGILVISGIVVEFHSLDVGEKFTRG